MAMMVKTYVLLCTVGLCTTLFVILITYGDNKTVPSRLQLRNKPINNSTRRLTVDRDNILISRPNLSREPVINDQDKSGLNSKQFEPSERILYKNNRQKQEDDAVNQLPQRMLKENNSKYFAVVTEDHSKSRYFHQANIAKHDPSNQIEDGINPPPSNDIQKQNNPPPPPQLQVQLSLGAMNHTLPDKQQMINEFNQYHKNNGVEFKPPVYVQNTDKIEVVQPAEPSKERNTIADAARQVDIVRSCTPSNDVALLKTHKCSSSTLQNILYRWGDARDLSFVLPKGNMPYLGNPAPFDIKYAIQADDGVYNILANHARFDERGLSAALPADTIYITILRNPGTQYESLYNYYRHSGRYGVSLERFLTNPSGFFSKEPQSTHIVGRNSMLFDLGLDARYMEGTHSRVNSYIQMLDKKFDLVLIAEYFSESLILLKDVLCWSMDDIVYLNQNARSKSSVTKVTTSMQQDIWKWNSADAQLYRHFNQTLWKKIEAYGLERMKEEVAMLKGKNTALTKDCVASTMKSNDPRMWYPPGVKMESFKVNPNAKDKKLCERITRPELTYMKLLADKQRSRSSLS